MKFIKIIASTSILLASLTSYIHSSSETNDFYEVVNEALSEPRGWPPLAYAVKLGREDVVKFFLDHGENPNTETPTLPLWYESLSSDHAYNIGNLFEGYTPLEIAVFYENAEMVKILTTYRKDNRAISEISHVRYTDIYWSAPRDIWALYAWGKIETGRQNSITTSPFQEALKTNNEELIIAVMQGYTNLEAFLQIRESITSTSNPNLIRSWLMHQFFLKEKNAEEIPDQIVDLFIQNTLRDLIAERDYEKAALLIDYGWPIKENEIKKLIDENNTEALNFLLSRESSYLGFDIYNLLLKNNLQQLAVEHLSIQSAQAFIAHNQSQTVEYLIDNLNFIPTEDDQHHAIKNDAHEIIALFISKGWYWKGALLQSVQLGKVDTVKTLLQSSLFNDEIEEAKILAYKKRLFEVLQILEATEN